MPKSTEYGIPDRESPEWTKERMQKATRFNDLPPEMQTLLAPKKTRGAQKAPTKTPTTIRLSADVLKAMRATGRGWQTRADETLRRQFVKAET